MINAITHNPFRLLGVYSNSSQKDIVANQGKLAAFLKVGKEITFPLDLGQYLPTIKRTTEIIEQVKSEISIPKGKLEAGQFWFIKQTPIDEIAFNNLYSGNEDKALDIWSKKEEVSSLQNRVILYLIKNDIANAINCAERLYDDFSEELVRIIAGETITITKEDLIKNFVDKLSTDNQISVADLQMSITRDEWKRLLGEQTSQPLISRIEASITESETGKRGTPREALLAGTRLMNNTKSDLKQLKQIVGTSDLKYQMVADRLGLQILQCAINYYNDSDDDDAAYKALPLQKYAIEIVVGTMAKDRCNENLKTLNEIISNMPPKEVMKEYRAIMNELEAFCKRPDLIVHSMTLLKNTKPHLNIIKTKLGVTNAKYLKLSTQVVSNALHNLIEEVNGAVSSINGSAYESKLLIQIKLKGVLTSAKDAMLLMDSFDLDDSFCEHYNKNRMTLMKMYNDVNSANGGSSTSTSSDEGLAPGCWVAIAVGIIIMLLNMCR